jgi:hypothetical protein
MSQLRLMPGGYENMPDDNGLGWTWQEIVKWALITAAIATAGACVFPSDEMIFAPRFARHIIEALN